MGRSWGGALLFYRLYGQGDTVYRRSCLIPVLQNLYLLRLGFDVQSIGLLVGLGQVVWAATALPADLLNNRIGLRNALMLGYSLLALRQAPRTHSPPSGWHKEPIP